MKKQYQIPVANVLGIQAEDVLTLLRASAESGAPEIGNSRSVIDFEA